MDLVCNYFKPYLTFTNRFELDRKEKKECLSNKSIEEAIKFVDKLENLIQSNN